MPGKMLCAALLLVATAVDAAAAGRWIHVRVNDAGPKAETVSVNFPLRSVQDLLPLIKDGNFRNGKVQINDHDMDAARLRAIWSAVRNAGDGEFVTVDSNDEHVRVARSGKYMIIKVEDRGSSDRGDGDRGRRARDRGERDHDRSTVDIKVPVTVVDALLSGEGDELNISAAISALDEHGPGDIVTVNDEDSHVRIWVDESQSGAEGEEGGLR